MALPHSPRLLPPLPPVARLLLLGVFAGMLAYLFYALGRPPEPAQAVAPLPDPIIRVPQLDHQLLATAKDHSREDRLRLEPEPLRHLLEQALDVGPTIAKALGMPNPPPPLSLLRAERESWRGRWLGYKGELVDLVGPREGHPVTGYGIYEATLRLAEGDYVIAMFSVPPPSDVRRTGIVRVEGYLNKLRDTTYPRDIQQAPLLVGREVRADYADWGPVTKLDASIFADLDESCWPGTQAWHTIDEDQEVPLWHLAAFVRDTKDERSFAEWRQLPTLNDRETLTALNHGHVARGEPMRILGTLIQRQVIAAPPNPAGIQFWTVAWVQVPDLKGHLVPVWVPQRDDALPLRSSLEVLGHYYRWYAYEGRQGDRFKVPLFLAADLREFHRETRAAMHEIGFFIGTIVLLLLVLVFYVQRSDSRGADQHARDMDARRRRRRRGESPQLSPGDPAEPAEGSGSIG